MYAGISPWTINEKGNKNNSWLASSWQIVNGKGICCQGIRDSES